MPDPASDLTTALAHLNAGRLAEAERDLRRVLAADPRQPRALHQLGLLARRAGQTAPAMALLERAIAADPANPAAQADLGNLRQEAGDLAGAVAAYRRAMALKPGWVAPAANLAAALLKLGDFQAVLEALAPLLARQPAHAHALAYRAQALWELGRDDEARTLVGLESLVFAEYLPPPTGFADFNAALATEIAQHPSLTAQADPTRRAVRDGAVTGNLLAPPLGPATAALLASLEALLGNWMARLPTDAQHPWLLAKPMRWRLIGWGNILRGAGHQAPHIHNLGWLSGVYYVAVPAAIRTDDPAQAGWIRFGRPGYGLPTRRPPETRALAPRAGQLFLFPSALWHETLPFDGEGERVSLAFDLQPVVA